MHKPSRTANWRRSAAGLSSPHRLLACLLLLIALAGAGLMAQPASARTRSEKLHPALQQASAATPNASVRVIVRRATSTQAADRAGEQLGGAKRRDMPGSASFAMEMTAAAAAKLADSPFVDAIVPDAELIPTGTVSSMSLTTIFPRSVLANQLWSLGITGQGVGVAVIDSGINPQLFDFTGATAASRIVARQVFTASAPASSDPSGHGTLVAGILAGNNWPSSNSLVRGHYIGIAPEANLIDLVVSDANGKSYTSDVVAAIDWAIANRTTYNIRVINLSMVSGTAESYKTSVLAAAVERAWFNGIFVAVAAGNAGPNTLQYPPANDPFVMTVGASDPMSTTSRLDDGMAPWSSYGVTQDGYSKPDVVAPGRYIPAPISSLTATIPSTFATRILPAPAQGYMWMSGTSMATPVVAGTAALIFQLHPEWTNDQVKWLLQSTSTQLRDLSGAALPGQGAGLVNAYTSALYGGVPSYANQGLTPSSQLTISGGGTTYNSASWSTASWSTASWSTASWSTASWSTASWSTASWSTTTSLQTSAVDVGLSGYREVAPGS